MRKHKSEAEDIDVIDMTKISATAGALAGAVARFVVGPLDVIKIRFQIQLEPIAQGVAHKSKYTSLRQAILTIIKEEGIQGLWRGTVPGQLLTIPYTAVQFVTLQHCKRLASQHGLDSKPSISYINGALAGAAGTIASYPFDLLRTTLAAQGQPKVYLGMADAATRIYADHGVRGLYRGIGVTLLEIMPYAALQFGLYDTLNTMADTLRVQSYESSSNANTRQPRRPAMQTFLCGLAAGTVAKLGTHPLDVAKKRFQVAGLARSAQYGQRVSASMATSLVFCLKEIAMKEGISGFYKGALPSVLKAAPSAAVTLVCYEFFMRAMMPKNYHSARR